MLPLNFKFKQPGAALMMALSAAFPLTAWAANAGRADFAVGDVRAISADGRSRPLTKGTPFDTGETIETGEGRAQLRFTDGAQVSLQPGSQFRIDDYNFSGQADGSEKGLFSLMKGGLRTITGWIGRTNRDNYKVTTAVATIGIRGTEYSVNYGSSITVTTGEGIIEICNAAGCLILNSGETAYVADVNAQPVMTDKKADVPPPPPEAQTLLSASETEDSPIGNFADLPTPVSQIASVNGTYTWTSGSITSFTGSNPGGVSGGYLSANLTTAPQISLGLSFMDGASLSGNGNLISGTTAFSGSNLSGTGGFCGGSGCSGSFTGIFTGANASGASVNFKATGDYNPNSVTGSATFTK
jgi:hypothetical protein